MKGFTDIHCHSVMTHYRNPEIKKSACEEIRRPSLSEALRSDNTQSDFGKLVKGGVGGIVITLYPIERKWMLPETNIPGLIEDLVSNITGFSIQVVRKLMKEEEDGRIKYYEDLLGEYNYLLSQVNKSCNGKMIRIATNYGEYKTNKQAGDTVSIVISIEGGHALSTIIPEDLTLDPEEVLASHYTSRYRVHVLALKNWGPNNDGSHTPFFITLAHHFWNMLVGHCESLPFIFDQKTGKESGFTPAGKAMLEDLLSTKDENGVPNKRRMILIDVKHMSPQARKHYYEHIRQIKQDTGLNIPVISSHSSIGDAKSLDCLIKGTDDEKSFDEPDNFFNTSTLSLNNEDIINIIESDGIIGIILHEGRIAAKMAFKKKAYRINYLRRRIKKRQNKIESMQAELTSNIREERKIELTENISKFHGQVLDMEQEMREGFICMIMANIYKIVQVYADNDIANKEKGWEHICIGSDFDGTINKLDFLGTSEQFPVIEEEMIKFMNNPRPLTGFDPNWTSNHLKTLHFGKQPEELVKQFMSDNMDRFLEKYFNEDYLKRGII